MPGSFFRVTFRDPHRLETPIWDPSKRPEEAEGFKYDPDIYEPEDENEGWDMIVFYRKEVEFLSKLIWAIEAGGLEQLGGDEEIFRSVAKKIRSIVNLKPIEEPPPPGPVN